MTATELEQLIELLTKAEQDLGKARAPKALRARLSEAHLAIAWLSQRKVRRG